MTTNLQKRIFDFVSKKLELKSLFLRRNLSQAEGSAKRQVPREKPAVRKRGTNSLNGLPLLFVPITTFCLGTWQIQRLEWKQNLIKELEEKMSGAPMSLPQDLGEVSNLEYHRVTVTGRFDHSKELYVGPRSSRHSTQPMSAKGMTSGPGVFVITPFKLSDRDETILVNRGHVAFKYRPPQTREAGQVQGEVTLTGVIRKTDRKPIFGGDPLKDGYWLYTDVDELAEVVEASPVLIDADANSTVAGGPMGGQTNVNLRNDHLTYIVTWYTLCALSSYMWYKTYRSPMPHKAVVEYIKKNHHRM